MSSFLKTEPCERAQGCGTPQVIFSLLNNSLKST